MVINILKDIIKIDTSNPGGNSGELVSYIIDRIKEFDFKYEIIRTSDTKVNLIIKIEGSSSRSVVLNGHIDTKPAGRLEEWKYNPLNNTLDNDRLYGLGASDMKGGVASMIALICHIGLNKIIPKWNLEFHFVDDEENNSTYGMRYIVQNCLLKNSSNDLAIVCEPTENSIVMESLGNSWKCIEVKGVKAHAGHYQEGVNANQVICSVLIKAVEYVKQLQNKNLSFPQFPNINIGILNGGEHPGTVADFAQAVIDIRVASESDKQLIIDEIEGLLSTYPVKYHIDDYLPGHYSWSYNSISTSVSDDLLRSLVSTVEHTLKEKVNENLFFGGSDAGYYADQLKIPTIIFGPGSLKQAHQPNEWTSITAVKNHFDVLRKWVCI